MFKDYQIICIEDFATIPKEHLNFPKFLALDVIEFSMTKLFNIS
jgi:hypothetical protein